MSWHYSQALLEEYSVGNCSDGEPSAQLKSTTTAEESSCNDKTTDTSHRSQSGTMSEPSMGDPGEDVLTSFLEAFPVRTFHAQEKERESTENAADSGPKWHASFAKYDHDSCLWRTLHCLFPEDLEPSSVNWSRWGSIVNGVYSPLAPLVDHTHENGCSLWPTPTKAAGRRGWGLGSGKFRTSGHARYGETVTKNVQKDISIYGWKLNPAAWEWMMCFPIGWTDLQQLETLKFQQWLRSHGKR